MVKLKIMKQTSVSRCCEEPSCHSKHVDIIEFTCSKLYLHHFKDSYENFNTPSCSEFNLVCVICNYKNFLVKK